MSSLSTSISLLISGEWREFWRRASAVVTGQALKFRPENLPELGYRQPEALPSKGLSHPPKLLAFGPSFKREGAPISQFELMIGLAEISRLDIYTHVPVWGPVSDFYKNASLEIRHTPELSLDTFALPKKYEQHVKMLSEKLKDCADCVYVNTIDMFPIIDAAQMAHIPCIWNIRESEPPETRLRTYHPHIAARARACFHYPEAVIFVADASRAVWSTLKTRENFFVIPNALRPDQFSQRLLSADPGQVRRSLSITSEEMLVLCIGTICERKRQRDALAAMELLLNEGTKSIHLVCLGADPDNMFVSMFENLPKHVKPYVHYVPETQRPEDFYAAADAYLCVSEYEAMPRTLLEAVSASVPIITTNVFGAAERFEHKKTALFVDIGDTEAIAQSILYLQDNPQIATKLSRSANTALRDEYDGMIAAYAHHVQNCLAKAQSLCAE